MKVLVLGGTGFIGRHVVFALNARGHQVVIGSRHPARAAKKLPFAAHEFESRRVRLEKLTMQDQWDGVLNEIDVVVNCVGILRERGAETYERVHHLAPGALAQACARLSVRRLIHVSALALTAGARSGFLTSKFWGERAVQRSGTDWTIVRPSLLDGEGGFGARWLRMIARSPMLFLPADANGKIAALDVRDLGEAIAILCETPGNENLREVELGGTDLRTMREYVAALRCALGYSPALCLSLPSWFARLASHICDLLHFSPFSYGHLELMRMDNVPRVNLLPKLLGREPRKVGTGDFGKSAFDHGILLGNNSESPRT